MKKGKVTKTFNIILDIFANRLNSAVKVKKEAELCVILFSKYQFLFKKIFYFCFINLLSNYQIIQMKIYKRYYIIFIALFISFQSFAQEFLTLKDAIQTGLKNIYSISIANRNVEVTKINNSAGNAGMLPTVAITGSQSNNISNSHQEDFSGNVKNVNSAKSSVLSAGIALNWTIFDGMNMFIERERLNELQQLGEIQAKIVIENTISQIIANYFNIVQQTKRLKTLQNTVAFSVDRKNMAEKKFQIGSSSEVAYLQARVDLNSDSSQLLNQEFLIQIAKVELNKLSVRDVAMDFNVSDSIELNVNLLQDELKTKTESQNTQLLATKKNVAISELLLKETYSPVYPKFGVFAGYNYSNSTSDIGLYKVSQSNGPSLGITLSYTIFNGFKNYRNTQNAKIQVLANQDYFNDVKQNVLGRVNQLYASYQLNVKLIAYENASVKLAQRNASIAMERFKVGQLSDLDLRQAQLKQLDAENRLLQAQYNAKLSEIELIKISGEIVK